MLKPLVVRHVQKDARRLLCFNEKQLHFICVEKESVMKYLDVAELGNFYVWQQGVLFVFR